MLSTAPCSFLISEEAFLFFSRHHSLLSLISEYIVSHRSVQLATFFFWTRTRTARLKIVDTVVVARLRMLDCAGGYGLQPLQGHRSARRNCHLGTVVAQQISATTGWDGDGGHAEDKNGRSRILLCYHLPRKSELTCCSLFGAST